MPDEEEREEPAPLGAVDLFEVAVAAARTGIRCAEFRPHHAVTEREQRAYDPSDHRLRPAHGGDDEWDGDERAHSDHIDHIQRGGSSERDAALELGGGFGLLAVSCHVLRSAG